MPDWKPTFPKWSAQKLSKVVPTCPDEGLDLLQVFQPPNNSIITKVGFPLKLICLTSVTRAKPKEKMEFPA